MTEYYGTWVNEKSCPLCGKVFIISSEGWAYKVRAGSSFKYFCSWHCFREQERIAEAKRAKRKPVPYQSAVGKADDIKECLLAGMRSTDICKKLGVCNASVNYWKKRLEAAGQI